MRKKLNLRRILFIFLLLYWGNVFGQDESLPSIQDGLVAYYPFNGNANDLSGNGLHGNILGGLVFGQDRYGVMGRAAVFNGVDAKVTVPSSPAIRLTEGTWSVWIKPAGGTLYPFIIDQDTYGWTQDGHLAMSPDNSITFHIEDDVENNYKNISTNAGAAPQDQWTNIVVTWGSDGMIIYVNGVPISANGYTKGVTSPGDLVIGSNFANYQNPGAPWFNGSIDDVRIYNRALSSSEIQALYGTTVDPDKVLFDDFNYSSSNLLYQDNGGIWYARTNVRNKITVTQGGTNKGELNLNLPANFSGTGAGDMNTPEIWSFNHYNGGTYFARVKFVDLPFYNADQIVETFWLQNSSSLAATDYYSEHDFEYLPYDYWDFHNPIMYSPAMWTTSWLKKCDKQDLQIKSALGDMWVDLIMKVLPNQYVEFDFYDDTGALINSWQCNAQYAPRTATAMQIFFNMWIKKGATSKASYDMKVDFLLFIQDDISWQRSDLVGLVNSYRANDIKLKDTAIPVPPEIPVIKENLLGTWDGQGVYFREFDTGQWTTLSTAADLIACGDLYGDCIDDLIGIWSGQAGVWVKNSANGSWAYLGSSPRHIAAGDMNGDGRVDLLGTWDDQGVCYRNSIDGKWNQLATPATLITAGDLDGDNQSDLVGIWPTQAGVWAKLSQSGSWSYLGSAPRDMATGDMNGDGRADLIGTWDGQGVFYRDSMTGNWTKMATPADQVTAGDLDGDGTDDLIGIWAGQAGVWVKYSQTQTWAYIGSSARDIAAGKMEGGAWSTGLDKPTPLNSPNGGIPDGPSRFTKYEDLSSVGPGGNRFLFEPGRNLIPRLSKAEATRIPGPGEPGFHCVIQKNIWPHGEAKKH